MNLFISGGTPAPRRCATRKCYSSFTRLDCHLSFAFICFLLCLASAQSAEVVWLDTQDFLRTSPQTGAERIVPESEAAVQWLAGGDVCQLSGNPPSLDLVMTINQPGEYRLFIRARFSTGYRYRLESHDWVEVTDRVVRLDGPAPQGSRPYDLNWFTVANLHDLPAGEVRLQLTFLAGPNGHYPSALVDVVALAREPLIEQGEDSPWLPLQKVSPDSPPENAGITPAAAKAARDLAQRRLSREVGIEAMSPYFIAGEFSLAETDFVLPYRLRAPDEIKPGERYPLLISLYGAGGRGTDNHKQLVANETAVARFNDPKLRDDFPAYLLLPQAPDWFSDEARPRVGMPAVPALSSLEGLVDELIARYPIDPERIYLYGQSLGGFGVLNVLCNRPDDYAAAIAVAGADPRSVTESSAQVPILLICGDRDERLGAVRATADKTRQLGGEPQLWVIEKAGHVEAWEISCQNRHLWEWLFQQKRRPRSR